MFKLEKDESSKERFKMNTNGGKCKGPFKVTGLQLNCRTECGDTETHDIKNISDGTVITISSPECKLYFIGGQYIEVCYG